MGNFQPSTISECPSFPGCRAVYRMIVANSSILWWSTINDTLWSLAMQHPVMYACMFSPSCEWGGNNSNTLAAPRCVERSTQNTYYDVLFMVMYRGLRHNLVLFTCNRSWAVQMFCYVVTWLGHPIRRKIFQIDLELLDRSYHRQKLERLSPDRVLSD